MFCRMILLSGLFCCSILQASDEQTRLLRKFHNIRLATAPQLDCPPESCNLAIRLDETFFMAIDDLANDLRIVNGQQQNIPFVLNRLTGNAVVHLAQQLPGKIVRKQPLPDGRTVIDFELDSPQKAITAVELADVDFQPGAILSIAIGDSGKLQTAIDQLPTADTSDWQEINRRRYPLPQPFAGKLIRLTVANGKINKLDTIRVYSSVVQQQPETAQTSEYNALELERSGNASSSAILLQTNKLPLTQLKINTSSPFYYCKITVHTSDDRQNWTAIASGSIRKVDLDIQQIIDFPEIRSKYMLIKIENLHGAALENLKCQLFGNTYEWLIPANPDTLQTLKIYYNTNEKIPRQQHDTDISPRRPSKFYQLSPPQRNPLYQAGVTDRRTMRHLIGAIMIIACGISGAVLLIRLPGQKKVLPED